MGEKGLSHDDIYVEKIQIMEDKDIMDKQSIGQQTGLLWSCYPWTSDGLKINPRGGDWRLWYDIIKWILSFCKKQNVNTLQIGKSKSYGDD